MFIDCPECGLPAFMAGTSWDGTDTWVFIDCANYQHGAVCLEETIYRELVESLPLQQ